MFLPLYKWSSRTCQSSSATLKFLAPRVPCVYFMSLYTILPSTPRLDELVAAVVLGDQSPLPTDGNAVLYQYTWPKEQEVAAKEEVFRRACTRGAPLRI